MDPVPIPIPTFLKALQLLALAAFFAGTFHIVRLFTAHRRAMGKREPDRTILTNEFTALERRALVQLNWPALIFIVLVGTYVLYQRPDLLRRPFVHVSLGYMAILLAYHVGVHRLHHLLKRGEVKWSALQLQVWAHLATILLCTLVVLLMFREQMTWVWGSAGLLVLGGMLIFLVERARRRPGPPRDA